MINKNVKNNSGFMAIMSAIIISVILLIIATTLGFNGFQSRLNILDSELKERSLGLADACIDIAMQQIASDLSYAGDVSFPVGSDSCYVGTITPSGTQRIFKTRGVYSSFHTNLRVTIETSDFSIISYEEISTF